MSDIIDDRVYFLERLADGTFSLEAERTLLDLGNNIPGYGDRITLSIEGMGTSTAEVVGRYFVRHLVEETGGEWTAWFIIVQTIDLQEADALFDAISEVYRTNVRSRPTPARTPAPNDGATHVSNVRHDFEWWAQQDKRRQKHAPLYKLDKPKMGALRFMAAHPECTTVDLIPRAGEKTMEALAKVGCVRPGGKDELGNRKWFITDEGLAEIKRDDTYTNWVFD